jgi:hypothetical protein
MEGEVLPVEQDPSYYMSKDHAAAFKCVIEKRSVVWSEHAAAYQAALECVNSKQSQDFVAKHLHRTVSTFCGDGRETYSNSSVQPQGSAWDDWCGKARKKLDTGYQDQISYFRQTLLCAVRLVLAALDRGSAEIIDAADPILNPTSLIFNYYRDQNRAAWEDARQLHQECVTIWRQGDGPSKRLALLEKAPWRCLASVIRLSFVERRSSESQDKDLL